jgi:hypothetical protein
VEFEIPETLDGLDPDVLAQLEADAVEAFDALRDGPTLNSDGLARLRQLATFVRDVRARQTQIEQAAAAVEAELDELAGQVHGDDTEDGENDPPGGGVADLPAGEEDGDSSGDVEPAGGEEPGGRAPAGQTPVTEAAPVLASLARRAAARQPKPKPSRSGRTAKVKAAPDVPNVPHGHLFGSVDELAQAFDERFSGMPRGATVRTRIKQGVARIELPTEQGLVASGGDDYDIVEHAASQARLAGGNLVAAGGWGAPSDTLWELCPGLETSEGILDLPSLTVTRGGLRYPAGLEFRDLYSGIGFVQTEGDSIAGTDKTCYRIQAPTFPETRLEVDGICLEQDIVQNAVWPENTRDVVRRAMTAHDHKINARMLAKMATVSALASSAFTLALGGDIDGDQTTTALLGAASLAATDYRTRYRMGRQASLEMPAPIWLLDWIRADMARRAGVNFFDVADEQITAWFTRRNILPRWVYDWQDGFVNAGGVGFGGATPPRQWPSTVDLLLYAPGTWVKGTRGIIDLSAVYDSTKLRDNEYIAMFSEEATLLIKRCNASYKVTVPLCPTGVTGQTVAFDCALAA